MLKAPQKFVDAVAFAAWAHNGIQRKSKEVVEFPLPYLDHCLDVTRILMHHQCFDLVTLQAAMLHDTLEDCPQVTEEMITEKFGPEVTMLVVQLTLPPFTGDRKDRIEWKKATQLAAIQTMDPRAAAIKIADKSSNVTSIKTHPPGWGLRACNAYCDSALEVVNAGRHRSALCGQLYEWFVMMAYTESRSST